MSRVKCSFSFDFSSPASSIVSGLRHGIEGLGGEFSGDDQSGSFSHVKILAYPTKMAGDYRIHGNKITVDITRKPAIGCGIIKSQIQKHLPG